MNLVDEESILRYKQLVEDQIYTNTDHAIMVIELEDGTTIIHYTLDASVRANKNNASVGMRLQNMLCTLFKVMSCYSKVILCVNESGRATFDKDSNPISWDEIIDNFINYLGFNYLGLYRNNPGEMAFGISVFASPSLSGKVNILPQNITTSGCAVVGICYNSFIYWCSYFTIKKEDNQEAFTDIVKLFDKYENTQFAFGDFNTIFPNVELVNILQEYELLTCKYGTFIGAYFDLVPV